MLEIRCLTKTLLSGVHGRVRRCEASLEIHFDRQIRIGQRIDPHRKFQRCATAAGITTRIEGSETTLRTKWLGGDVTLPSSPCVGGLDGL
jgi:hypothetical protein